MLNTCPTCGTYRADKTVLSEPDRIVCPDCGAAFPFLRQPLFILSGASGTGKSTVLLLLTEIQIVDEQVSEISQLQQQKREIQDRMAVIQNLQGSRPVIVRVFDELVKTLPDGVYFETVQRNGELMEIVGVFVALI